MSVTAGLAVLMGTARTASADGACGRTGCLGVHPRHNDAVPAAHYGTMT